MPTFLGETEICFAFFVKKEKNQKNQNKKKKILHNQNIEIKQETFNVKDIDDKRRFREKINCNRGYSI